MQINIGGHSRSQCKKPSGRMGRFALRNMNRRHGTVTDWGLSHFAVSVDDTVLDVGCGGGRTLAKLAGMASAGKIWGVDHSPESVAVARELNAPLIAAGRVEIREGSVSQLPFPDAMFDAITAVETHFWWPDLRADLREVCRVLKPGGRIALIAEVYKGASAVTRFLTRSLELTGMTLLTAGEHRELLAWSGLADVEVITSKTWICATARKPLRTWAG